MSKLLTKSTGVSPSNLKRTAYTSEDLHDVIRITETGAGKYVEISLSKTIKGFDDKGLPKNTVVRYTSDEYVKEIANIIKPYGATIDAVSKAITHNGISIGGEVKSFLAL
jgi:hypothetical protein